MYKNISSLLLFLFIIPFQTRAQISPKESAALNYRLVGFSLPKAKPNSKYTIEIAAGNYHNEDSFRQNIIKSFESDKNKITGEVPAFGKQYTWRSITKTDSTSVKSELYHFTTMMSKVVDTNVTRLRITKEAEKYADAYVFMDGSRTLYDMHGVPVWFLPEIVDKKGKKAEISDNFGDMKLSEQGSITFLANRTGGQVFEIDYNGNTLWEGPDNGKVSGDSTEHYHHEFTRLSNGHYMVMGSEKVTWKLPGKVDSSFLKKPGNQKKIIWDSAKNVFYEVLYFGTLIEYDIKGNVVWSWKSSKYFKGSDIFSQPASHGAFHIKDVHANGFYFDKKNKAIYVSFKGCSRVLKVKYPEGTVVNAYGKKHDNGNIKGYGPDLFMQQHNCRISKSGDLYLYNNNDRYTGALPTLIMMHMPVSKNDSLKRIWEFECTVDSAYAEKQKQSTFSSGGSVMELPDNSMLGCMSSPRFTKVFIVSKHKEILWSALPEAWNPLENKWNFITQYKASIVTRNELEQLIWNQQKSNTPAK